MQATTSGRRRASSANRLGPSASFDHIQSVVERLRLVKGAMTYSQMEGACGIHATLLCRYVTGSTRPSREQAELIERTLLRKSGMMERLRSKMLVGPKGYLDLFHLTCDPHALKWISAEVASLFSGTKCDRILTTAASGITLATAIAIQMKVPVVYAMHNKEYGVGEYLEADLYSPNPSQISTLYLPRNLTKKGESILIVDDVATSGRTMSGLISLVAEAGCKVSGVFVLASKSDGWKESVARLLGTDTKISVLFDLEGK
jgi:adenine/guanine phosphoribosyltransferase-like PRPP-binding protein